MRQRGGGDLFRAVLAGAAPPDAEVIRAGGVGCEDGEGVRPFGERGVAGGLPDGVALQAAHLREGRGCLRQHLAVEDEATSVIGEQGDGVGAIFRNGKVAGEGGGVVLRAQTKAGGFKARRDALGGGCGSGG